MPRYRDDVDWNAMAQDSRYRTRVDIRLFVEADDMHSG